jgi:hypothetical protein
MAGLVPAIHVFVPKIRKTWITGTGPVMTAERLNCSSPGSHFSWIVRPLPLRQRLQTLEGQALGVLDAGEIEPANEGSDHFPVAIGQRNHGINGNSLGVHVISSGFLMRPQASTA